MSRIDTPSLLSLAQLRAVLESYITGLFVNNVFFLDTPQSMDLAVASGLHLIGRGSQYTILLSAGNLQKV